MTKDSERDRRIRLTMERDNDEAVVRMRNDGFGLHAAPPAMFDEATVADLLLATTHGESGMGCVITRLVVHGGRAQRAA